MQPNTLKWNRVKLHEIKQSSYRRGMQLIGSALFFVTVDYKVHMLAFGSSWQWGCGEVGVRVGVRVVVVVVGVRGRNRTSCYVKTNLSREKQCLRPPLKVLQVVRVSDIFKLRVMEAISFARCERSSAIASCLSEECTKTNELCQQPRDETTSKCQ